MTPTQFDLNKPIPQGKDQDMILNAVTDEIANRGFVIAKADKFLIGQEQGLYGL